MRVLSIDVGRHNLALCVLSIGEDPRGQEDVICGWLVTHCDPTPRGIRDAMMTSGMALDGIDDVVIERQPPKNATMSRLQHYLEMFFAMHDKPVTVQDAKHKLAFAASTPWWDGEGVDSWTYHMRKKLSVATTARFLEATSQPDAWRALFKGSRKKDDLGDCLLQGMAYAHNVRPLEAARRAMPPAVVKPRKPTAAQDATGKYSKPNIVYLLKKGESLETNKKLAKAVDRHFGGADAPELVLSLQSSK